MENENQNIRLIGERQYSFGYIPAGEATKMLTELLKLFGKPALTLMLQMWRESGAVEVNKLADANVDTGTLQVFVDAFGELVERLDGDKLVVLMAKIFKYVTCDGKLVHMDSTFAGGKMDEMFAVFFYAIIYNYKKVFRAGRLLSGVAAN